MYLNTTYKAFVAETAAKVAAEISKSNYNTNQQVFADNLMSDNLCDNIAIAAVNVAGHLAQKLEEWWESKGDRSTVMFDPADSPTTRIENELADIAQKLEDIEMEMEREYDNEHDC